MALDLPDNEKAPKALSSHVRQELYELFNIGKKRAVSETYFIIKIEPLRLDDVENKVGYLRALLERVDELKIEHYNSGSHRRFEFTTKTQQDRLYSVVYNLNFS